MFPTLKPGKYSQASTARAPSAEISSMTENEVRVNTSTLTWVYKWTEFFQSTMDAVFLNKKLNMGYENIFTKTMNK
jgi:hypothetical protein